MSQPERSSSPTRRIVTGIALVAVTYGLVEAAAFVAYEPLTGEVLGAEAAESDAPAAPDVRVGREQAGLGMRDASMSVHPYFGYVFTPRAEDAAPGPIKISPDGFLDAEQPIRKRNPSRLLVGVTGGSVAGQLGTWHSERLRRSLMSSGVGDGREIEFVFLGMPGYHQPQQLQQLTYVLAQGGELDILINVDGFNEIAVPAALNAPRGTHPLFPMNWSMVALDVPDLGVRRDIGAIEYLQAERSRRADEFANSWTSFSYLARLLWKREDQRLAALESQHAWQLQQFQVEETPFFVRGPERHHNPPEGLIPFCVDVWKRSSLQMQALCSANGIRYLHVLQPNQYVPDSKPFSEQEQNSAYDAEGPYRPVVEEGYPLLRAAGEELSAAGVEFVDLSPLFEGVSETVYIDNCCHFNGHGNELMSAVIADALAL